MTVADVTPDLEHIDRSDRAFLGHPKGLGYLAFVEACERFSYYSMALPSSLAKANKVIDRIGKPALAATSLYRIS